MRTLAVLAAVLVLGGCSESLSSLEERVDGRSGVDSVEVWENDGDDAVPFVAAPKHVRVRMEADASADEVMAVFDAYDDPIEDDELDSVEVVLAGPKQASLSAGEGILVTRDAVEDLVANQADDAVVDFRREAHPVSNGVRAELAPTRFAELTAYADRYRDTDLEIVEVVAGPFVLIRDEVNEDPQVTAAREELAHLVDDRFGLLGASVSGRGPLELVVARADEVAVRRFVGSRATPAVRRVLVRAS